MHSPLSYHHDPTLNCEYFSLSSVCLRLSIPFQEDIDAFFVDLTTVPVLAGGSGLAITRQTTLTETD